MSEKFYKFFEYKKNVIIRGRVIFTSVATIYIISLFYFFTIKRLPDVFKEVNFTKNRPYLIIEYVSKCIDEIAPLIYGLTLLRVVFKISTQDEVDEEEDN